MGNFLAVLLSSITILLLLVTILTLLNKFQIKIIPLLIFSIVLRFLLIALYVNIVHYDVYSYKIVGDSTLLGNNIYPEEALKYHPYLPFLLYIEALAVFFSSTGLPYMLFMKIFFSFFDVLNIVLIYLLTNKSKKMAFLYAVNPTFMYLAAVHGQIDQIPIFFILLAAYFLQKKKDVLSFLSFGLGIMVKTWPIILVFIFVKHAKNRIIYLLGAGIIPIISVIIYSIFFNANLLDIINTAFGYKGFATWGLGMIFGQLAGDMHEKIFLLVTDIVSTDIIVTIILLFLVFSAKNLIKEIFLFLLIFSVFSLRGANPIWLLPFVILISPKFSSFWIVLCGLYSGMTSLGEVVDTYKIQGLFFLEPVWKVNTFALWILQIAMLASFTNQIINHLKNKVLLVKSYLMIHPKK